MGELDKSGTVTLQELLVTSTNRCRGEAPHREGSDHSRRVHGENKGGEGYVSGDVPPKGKLAGRLTHSNHIDIRLPLFQ